MCCSFDTTEAKVLQTFKEKNEESGRLWKSLSEEERQAYNDQARAVADGDEQPINFKRESEKILKQLHILVSTMHQYSACHIYWVKL